MKRFLLFPLCLFTLHGKEIPRAKPEAVGMSSDKLAKAAEVVQGYIDDKKIAGAITVVARNARLVHLQTYGQMDIERKKPMQEDAIFRIFSMSKAIVTAGAMVLHEEGKFQLEDPVSKFLPQFKKLKVLNGDGDPRPAAKVMTVADLMCHTSGLSYGFVGNTPVEKAYQKHGIPGRAKDLDEFINKVSKVPLRFEPGEGWLGETFFTPLTAAGGQL